MASRSYPSFLIYVDKAGEFRWRYQAANGLVLADSGEAYHRLSDCERAVDLMKRCADSQVWETTEVAARRS